MNKLILLWVLLVSCSVNAQTNVRAWYADGQIWIVWNITLPLTETVGVYASPDPFTTTDEATLIGRPFHLDYIPTAMKEQFDTAATYRIPDGNSGVYTLGPTEGLFVFTPHQSGSMYFAVLPWGETQVTAGDNSTDETIPFVYDPINDPVECHLQMLFPSPFTAGYLCAAFYMWADGRDNHLDARPDFPVMANAAKNGMPGFFLVSIPNNIDTSQSFPLSIWLHGGGGNSRQSLAGSRSEVNINPVEGILLSHNDDMFGYRHTTPVNPENPTWHFGWRKSYDPFTENNLPAETDTIINYTQRRYLWIDEWLIRHYNIDPARIHINGHSMGSAGATALAKAYPDHYASATIFNNGFGGPDDGTNQAALFGEPSQNFPTNLVNRNGEPVRLLQLFDIISNIAPARDLPVFRSYHGKNDDNGTMRWDAYVIENYHKADSLGHGMHLYWSERPHGIDLAPDFNDHWIMGLPSNQQTITDNVSWEESNFRSDISYPAFYNHRMDSNAHDPGDGTIGTGPNGVGDDWGTWGGWHRWDNASLTDEPEVWAVDAWLEENAVFDADNCPYSSLTADLAVRKPVLFKPSSGTMINWKVEDLSTLELLQSGTTIAGEDDLVTIPGIILYPGNTKKVRITINTEGVSTNGPDDDSIMMSLFPNPSTDILTIKLNALYSEDAVISILDSRMIKVFEHPYRLEVGENEISVPASVLLPSNTYIVQVRSGHTFISTLWIKL